MHLGRMSSALLVLLIGFVIGSTSAGNSLNGTVQQPKDLGKQPTKTSTGAPATPSTGAYENSTGPGSYTYIAMCLIVRDQAEDLPEWLRHYLKLGVRRFYIFDHGTQPLLLPTFANLAYAGIVEYHWVTLEMIAKLTNFKPKPTKPGHRYHGVNSQLYVYEQCLQRYHDRHQWIAFFDSDEFLMLRDPSVKDLPTFLKAYEPYGGLVVQWTMFGSSGHLTRPAGSTLESYWKCHESLAFKSIVNTRYGITTVGNPHAFKYRDGAYAVDEKFQRQDGAGSQNRTADQIVLYHYVTKSLEEFEAKSARGSGAGNHKQKVFLDATERHSVHNCTDAVSMMKGRVWDGEI